MSTKFYSLVFLFTAITFESKAQNANTTLSNLTSPTKVNANLLPDKDDNRDLGNLNKAWSNLYLDSNIYLGGTKFIAAPVKNSIAIGNNALKKIGRGNANVAVGDNALSLNTTGYSNVAIGKDALKNNISGHNLVAVGDSALFNQGTDLYGFFSNTAVGNKALFSNVTGYYNTAFGYQCLYSSNSTYCDAFGYEALYSNTTGGANAAFGAGSLHNNTTGEGNAGFGGSSLYGNTTGSWNSAIGYGTLENNTTGGDNTALGAAALQYNTTGYDNTALGSFVMDNNTTGHENVAIAPGALDNDSSGSFNVAIGIYALLNTTTSGNTASGYEAGHNITTGSYNTFLGYTANSGSIGAGNNMMALGNGATVTSSNHVVIGNSSVTSIGGYANWSNLSDGRVKKNIKQNVPGLSFINKLQPITYNLDLDAADKIIDRPVLKDKDKKIIQATADEIASRKAKEKIVYTGFIAQDVEKAAQSLNYDFSGVDKPDNANTLYGLRYSDFVVPLVKGEQELSKENDSLKSEIQNLKSEMEQLKQLVISNQSMVNGQQATAISFASLSQNTPNPFSNSTTISYSIPQQFSSAKIIITDKNGSSLKEINLSNNKGSLTVDASTLINGAYQYSLVVDGRMVTSKQMIISK